MSIKSNGIRFSFVFACCVALCCVELRSVVLCCVVWCVFVPEHTTSSDESKAEEVPKLLFAAHLRKGGETVVVL